MCATSAMPSSAGYLCASLVNQTTSPMTSFSLHFRMANSNLIARFVGPEGSATIRFGVRDFKIMRFQTRISWFQLWFLVMVDFRFQTRYPISDKISFLVFDFCFDFDDFLLFGFLTTDFWDKWKFSMYTMNTPDHHESSLRQSVSKGGRIRNRKRFHRMHDF